MIEQQMNHYNNNFVGHNRDVIEKFRKYDDDRRMAFMRLRDVLIDMAGEKRKFIEEV